MLEWAALIMEFITMQTRRQFLMQTTAAGIAAATSPSAVSVATSSSLDPINSSRRLSGVVHTVQGPLHGSKLGFTLPHEHLFASSAGFWNTWPEFFGGRENFIKKVTDKLKAAKDEGIDTIVDVTPADVGRDIRFIEEVSRRSGMQIIACTGHWLYPSLSMAARSVEQLTDFFVLEIERGIEGTDIKPGVIKVATDQGGMTPFQEKALRAAARASQATGIPITTHTYAPDCGGGKQAEIFESEGLNPAMVCLGHSDDSNDISYLMNLGMRDYTIGMDHLTWGIGAKTVLSWQQRAEHIKKLIDAGLCQKVFMSNDWYFGASIAGSGFMKAKEDANPDGILFCTRKIIPYLKKAGVTDHDIRTITVDNPRRFFAGI